MRPTLARALALVAAALAWVPAQAQANEYRSIAAPAILFDAPSERAKKVAIILPGTPVEQIVVLDRWIKVRDASGAINWVDRRVVSEKRTVQVNVARLAVRSEASATAPVSFEAARSVVLELIEPPRFGWVKLRHPDGQSGFAKAVEVWGL